MKTYQQYLEEINYLEEANIISIEKSGTNWWVGTLNQRGRFIPEKKFKTEKLASEYKNFLIKMWQNYDIISNLWKKSFEEVPVRSVGAHEYPSKLFKSLWNNLETQFGKNKFTKKQVNDALFSDKFSVSYDSWEYLARLITKK